MLESGYNKDEILRTKERERERERERGDGNWLTIWMKQNFK
jgi:hypothetical protein